VAVDSLVVTENLGKVFSTAVGDGPLKLAGVPFRLGGFTFLFDWGSFFSFLLAFFAFFLNRLFDDFGFDELLKFIFSEVSFFLFVLERDDSGNFSDDLFNAEKLIHVAKGETVVLTVQLAVVAKTFKEDILLAGSLLSNSGLNHLHNNVEVEMNGGVFSLAEFILDSLSNFDVLRELFGLTAGFELFAKFGLSADVHLDKLVDRQIKHVVFGGEVSALAIDGKTLLVVHDNNLSSELATEVSL